MNINHIFNNPNNNNDLKTKKILENDINKNLSNFKDFKSNIPSEANYTENSDLLNKDSDKYNKYEGFKGERKEEEDYPYRKSDREILEGINKFKRNVMVKRKKNPLNTEKLNTKNINNNNDIENIESKNNMENNQN